MWHCCVSSSLAGWANCQHERWIVYDFGGRRYVAYLLRCYIMQFTPSCYFIRSTAGGTFQMQECSSSVEASDGRSVFAATPSGQMKMPRLGNYCLTISGDGAAKLDVAPSADVSATSSSAQHAASSIVDGSSDSHWASGFDPTSAVDVILDFGAKKLIETVTIEWEHAPLVN